MSEIPWQDRMLPEYHGSWMPCDHNDQTDKVLVFRNKFGRIPFFISIYFSPDDTFQKVFPVVWCYEFNQAGNPLTVEVSAKEIRLHIYGEQPTLHGVWSAETGAWSKYRAGYFGVVVV